MRKIVQLSAMFVGAVAAICLNAAMAQAQTQFPESPTPNSGDPQRITGVLQSKPISGTLGDWVIASVTVTAKATTQFPNGSQLATGSCVRADYTIVSGTKTAREIRRSDDCGGDHEGLEAKGVISSRPDGLFGNWVIGGISYQAISGTTTFRQEHGTLNAGKCAEVKYAVQGADRVALRIASESADDCGNGRDDGDDDHGVYGQIKTLPNTPGLLGIWVIGEREYTVTASTKLERGPFTPTLFVEVHYTRTLEGMRYATKIEGKQRIAQPELREGRAIGRIESRPVTPTVQGVWVIAGATYSVTAQTRVTGTLNVTDCVKVEFVVAAGNLRVAKSIRPSERCEVTQGKPRNKAYGFVETMPITGFVGSWVINGMTYSVTANTQISEARGALAVGAFVEVKFLVQDGVRVAQEIETHVPPRAGSIDDNGKLQNVSVASAPETTNATWVINGTSYVILDATVLDDAAGVLTNGQTVSVNAYTDATGQRVATRVAAVGNTKVFVPAVKR